jgi:hypothetical protein
MNKTSLDCMCEKYEALIRSKNKFNFYKFWKDRVRKVKIALVNVLLLKIGFGMDR